MTDQNWKFLTGDVNWEDYGGKFYRRVETCFFIITVMNWFDTVGEDEATDEFNVSVDVCDIAELNDANKKDLLQSCGWDGADEDDPLVWAEIMHSYGMKAPLWDANGDDIDSLMSEAKMEGDALIEDSAEFEERMNRPVNAIGSTAREYMKGDLNSAMDRALAQETEMLMMGPEMKPTFTMRVDHGFIKRHKINDDPLAYTFGYMHGHTGAEMDDSRGELAPAYIEGHALGIEVAAGRQHKPDWHKGTV
jgi:hypothetical protein